MVPEVTQAARRTLRAGTVRLWHRGHWSPEGRDFSMTQVGVADLARKRTALHSGGSSEGWDEIEDWLRRKNTRIVAEADEADDDGPHRTFRVGEVLINMNMHGQFFVVEEGDRTPAAARSTGDPLWIVERLAEPGVLGDDRTFRFTAGVRHDGTWTADPLGRLAEVTWTRTHRGRPRAPFSRGPHRRSWSTLCLEDYGLAIEVELPDAFPPVATRLTPRAVWETWQALRPRRR